MSLVSLIPFILMMLNAMVMKGVYLIVLTQLILLAVSMLKMFQLNAVVRLVILILLFSLASFYKNNCTCNFINLSQNHAT